MSDKRDTRDERPEDVPTTNVKAGFPGTTSGSLHADDPAGQPTQPPEDKNNPQAGQEGPSASSHPGPHVIDDGSEPLPGQPEKDSASSAKETVVREKTPPTKK
jgi:hypothetical protein